MSTYWKPKTWVAILLGVFLPAFTFLYLNKPKPFWFYFLLSCLISIMDRIYQTSFVLIFSLICPVHAYIEAKTTFRSCQRAWYSKWWGIPTICGSFFIIVFLCRSFLFEPFVVPASSMEPTIKAGGFILVKKVGYGTYGTYGITLVNQELSSPDLMQRGKLYAFYPPEIDVPYVKRLIALPGDTLSIRGNEIRVNNSVLATEKLYEKEGKVIYKQQINDIYYLVQRTNKQLFDFMGEMVVPEKSYFFMGDNRDKSMDSRYLGYVTSDSIVGEVIYFIE